MFNGDTPKFIFYDKEGNLLKELTDACKTVTIIGHTPYGDWFYDLFEQGVYSRKKRTRRLKSRKKVTMDKKHYIENFGETFNYTSNILYIHDSVNMDHLLEKLKADTINHLYNFDFVKKDRYFYIENYDLNLITVTPSYNEMLEMLDNGYNILQLKEDKNGFYVVIRPSDSN